MRAEDPTKAPKGPRFNPSEVAERILRAAPIDINPITIEESREEGILAEKFSLEGYVQQSHSKTSQREVLWSEGFKSCTAVILRAPKGTSMLMHAEAGHWYALDRPWEADEQAQQFVEANPGTQMIIVRRRQYFPDSFNLKLGYSLLERLQVSVLKIVEVEADYPASGIAYDPVADQIYVDQRGVKNSLSSKDFRDNLHFFAGSVINNSVIPRPLASK